MNIRADKDFGARECPACATEVAANCNRCPICGYLFPQPTRTQSNLRIWGAIVMLILFILMVLGLSL